MTTFDQTIIGLAKALAWGLLIATFNVVMFRFGVGALWGSRSDLGMLAAPFLAAAAILGTAYLVRLMFRDVRQTLQGRPEPTSKENEDDRQA